MDLFAKPAATDGMRHFISGAPMNGPHPADSGLFLAGMGCFWGAERRFWQQDGVIVTAAGYAGGSTLQPNYEEVCRGHSGHAEVVQVVYDGQEGTLKRLLKLFWESHDPTQGMRQGNDIGSQYRSVLFMREGRDLGLALQSRDLMQKALAERGFGPITTEISTIPAFHYAEDYHQQYLAKNPHGYCGLKGTGISCAL